MLIKKGLHIALLLFCFESFGQITEDFEDDDLSDSPEWTISSKSGSSDFIVADGRLQSAGPSSSSSIFMTTSVDLDFDEYQITWSFDVTYANAPSSSNYVQVYLASDRSDLDDNPSGFYLQLGESGSGDGIDLREVGNSSVLIEDQNDLISSGISESISVSWSSSTWTLRRYNDLMSQYDTIGMYQGDVPDPGSFFGVRVKHSSTRNDDFFFDNIRVSLEEIPDTQAPILESLRLASHTNLNLLFNEPIEPSSLSSSTIQLMPDIEIEDIVLTDDNRLQLSFDSIQIGEDYQVEVEGLSDTSGNEMDNQILEFKAVLFHEDLKYREIQINEFLADPDESTGIPEFVELLNNSDLYVSLKNWTLSDSNGSSSPFDSMAIGPGDYVVLTSGSDASYFSGFTVLSVTGFPNFNSSTEDGIWLYDGSGELIDVVSYSSSNTDGYSMEQINPNLPCSLFDNFLISTNQKGSSAGSENSAYDPTSDTKEPELLFIEWVNADTLLLLFSEVIEQLGDYGEFGGADVSAIGFEDKQLFLTIPSVEDEAFHRLQGLEVLDCSSNQTTVDTLLFMDWSSPQVEKMLSLTEKGIAVIFHEPVDPISAEKENNYSINGETPSKAEVQDSSAFRVHLTFDDKFISDNAYSLRLMNIQDSLGNTNESSEVEYVHQDDVEKATVLTGNLIQLTFEEEPSENGMIPSNFLIPSLGHPSRVTRADDPKVVWLEFDESPGENKEFELYISNIKTLSGKLMSTPAPNMVWDTRRPTIAEVEVIDSLNVAIAFSEPVQPASVININHYEWLENIEIAQVVMTTENEVKLTLSKSLTQEYDHTLTVMKILDLAGNELSKVKKKVRFDVRPPQLLSLHAFEDGLARAVFSEKVLQDSLQILSKDQSLDYRLIGPDSSSLLISYKSEVPNSISFINLCDMNGNCHSILNREVNTKLIVSDLQAKSSSSFVVSFNRPIPEFDTPVITMDSILRLEEFDTYTYLAQVSRSFEDEESFQLQVKVESLGLDTLVNGIYEFPLKEFEKLDSSSFLLSFYEPIDTISFNANSSLDRIFINSQNAVVVMSSVIQPNEEVKIDWVDGRDIYGRMITDGNVSFTWDTQAPSVVDVSQSFNEMVLRIDEKVENVSVELAQQDSIQVVLNDSLVSIRSQLEDKLTYLVFLTAEDESGNKMDTSFSIQYFQPDVPFAGDLIFTEIMADPFPSNGLNSGEYLEIYNTSRESIDLSLVYLADARKVVGLPDLILDSETYLAIGQSGEHIHSMANWPSLDNDGDSLYLINALLDTIKIFYYDPDLYNDAQLDDGGISLEWTITYFDCDTLQGWFPSQDSLGGSPGKANSPQYQLEDKISPQLISIRLVNESLTLEFDESIDTVGWSLSLEAEKLILNAMNDSAISVDVSLESGLIYQIELSGVVDCSGNEVDTTFSFSRPAEPAYGQLLISELMADPTPSHGLPEYEYIEIFNNSDLVISLEDVMISNGERSVKLHGQIDPASYLVLSSKSWNDTIPSIRLSGLPTLPNDQGLLYLSHDDTVISYVNYSELEGGKSLELKNSLDWDNQNSWSASSHENGGTPGFVNTNLLEVVDNTSPQLLDVYIMSEDSLMLTFNESMSVRKMKIDGHELLESSSVMYLDNPQKVDMHLINKLSPESNQIITIDGYEDGSGNLMIPTTRELRLPVEKAEGVLISEVLFNPKQGGVDFVELYNNTNYDIRLDDLLLLNHSDTILLETKSVFKAASYLVLTPSVSQLSFDLPQSVIANCIEWKLPPMNDDSGLILVAQGGLVIDSLSYDKNMHSSLLDDTEGVSLERVSWDKPSAIWDNWQSASGSSKYATPGFANSQRFSQEASDEALTITPAVFVPGSSNPSFEANAKIAYELDAPGYHGSVFIVDAEGRTIHTLVENGSMDVNGFFVWDGASDYSLVASPGSYLIVMDLYHPNGERHVMRETVVIGFR